jgi:hypothetical protein
MKITVKLVKRKFAYWKNSVPKTSLYNFKKLYSVYFILYINYLYLYVDIHSLDFKSEPNYYFISNLLISIATENNIAINDVYEWTDEYKAKIQMDKIPPLNSRQKSLSIANI